ncbi:hypothetical protein CLV67_10479 [Actinoplanes italicus]|uniref:Uncharacterized protein n=2 Tax=Actinoplanes italicus TaxID=113567 RepID=A0A2T0KGJ4_9ACTN|nr:hypothetical protein CLV67_10479 [Actinoplanes italicus]
MALTVAALGASAGAWLGWRSPADLPADQQARALVAAAVADPSAEFVERFDAVFGYQYDGSPILGGDDYMPGFAVVTVNVGAGGFEALAGRARAGFERAGWSTGDSPYGDGGFVARRDGLYLTAYGAVACVPADVEACGSQLSGGTFGGLGIQFERDRPALAVPLSAAGWLAGLLAGWFVPARRGPLMWSGLVLAVPATLAVTATALVPENDPVWDGYMFLPFRPLALIGALLILAALVRGHGDAPAAGGSAGASRSPAQKPKFWV